ncbi:MAG: hypothetical protein ACRERE_34155 [Candidatus Entotheonellia bacterium]
MTSPRTLKNSMHEIALLFGIPVNQEEFVSRVSESDYLRRFNSLDHNAAERQAYLESAWENEHRPWVADPFGELMEAALRLDVDVRTQATLATLREVTAQRSVVVVFAHWKGPEIVYEDLVAPVDECAFVERVRENDRPLNRWLLDRFRNIGLREATAISPVRRWPFWPFASRHDQPLHGILDECLSAEIPEHLSVEDGVDEVLEHQMTRAARRRDTLNALFQGLLRPGNRLELFDGLHAKEVVESIIAPDFEGVLDLTTCTSTVLADFIAARRDLRLRTVQFPTVQEPLWAAKCVKATIELIAAAEFSYLEARNLILRKLEEALYEMQWSKS